MGHFQKNKLKNPRKLVENVSYKTAQVFSKIRNGVNTDTTFKLSKAVKVLRFSDHGTDVWKAYALTPTSLETYQSLTYVVRKSR